MNSLLYNSDIKLEKFKTSDAQDIYQAIKNSYNEISPWLSWLTPNYSLDDAKGFILLQQKNWAENIEYAFTIKTHKDELLGVISLHLYDTQNDVASIGYWMDTKYSKKGYCTKALKLLIKNTLKQLNLIRIEVIVATENIASSKVALKAGAQFEAVLKNRIRLKGQAVDANLYAFTG